MRSFPFILIQATWGLPQTIAGCAVCLAHRRRPHFRFHGAIVTLWENPKGMSLGPFIFLHGNADQTPDAADKPTDAPADASPVPVGVDPYLLVHEYGHCVQSLILGPLYLPLVGLPSLLWSNVPRFERYRLKRKMSYYDFLPERSASQLGDWALNM